MTREEIETRVLDRLGRFGGDCALNDEEIPDEILCKPGEFTDANRRELKDVLKDLRKRGKIVHFERINWLARTTQ